MQNYKEVMNEEQAEWTMRDVGHGIEIEPSIAWVGFGSSYSKEEHLDHARLIAAAPKLLAALQKMVETFSKCSSPAQGGADDFTWLYRNEFSQAKDAIKLATNG